MPKMKTKRALAKRVKQTGTGKLKRGHAYTSHLAPRKTHKQKVHLRMLQRFKKKLTSLI